VCSSTYPNIPSHPGAHPRTTKATVYRRFRHLPVPQPHVRRPTTPPNRVEYRLAEVARRRRPAEELAAWERSSTPLVPW
jgi:hypothetical protein